LLSWSFSYSDDIIQGCLLSWNTYYLKLFFFKLIRDEDAPASWDWNFNDLQIGKFFQGASIRVKFLGAVTMGLGVTPNLVKWRNDQQGKKPKSFINIFGGHDGFLAVKNWTKLLEISSLVVKQVALEYLFYCHINWNATKLNKDGRSTGPVGPEKV